MNIIAEYVWIDEENLRSKIKIFTSSYMPNITTFPEWNFDGSSTGQSETEKSDLLLKPVYYCKNPFFENTETQKFYLVLCQVMNSNNTPHETNNYNKLCEVFKNVPQFVENDMYESWFGIEQEYMILDKFHQIYNDTNINKFNYNKNQHYCSVGMGKSMGREIAENHMLMCINAGIKICGINSEVTPSQWEFQIGPLNAFDVSNQLWMARYILIKIAEKYDAVISFHPKPFPELNGSGAHTNFSTKQMREKGGLKKIYEAIDKLSTTHKEHILVYGKHNELRLSGTNETAHIDTFSYGNCDRGSSIRIPLNVVKDECGYLEDIRPASNMDPYLVTSRILQTIFN